MLQEFIRASQKTRAIVAGLYCSLLMLTNAAKPPEEKPAIIPVAMQFHPVLQRKHLGNGVIPILMYHQIRCGTSSLEVCPESLLAQLYFMQEHNFLPVSLNEYLTSNYTRVPDGAKPYLVTFDDTPLSQFSSKHSAIAVLEQFRNETGTEVPAIFFAITNKPLFDNAQTEIEKLEYLRAHGYTIANHTANHVSLLAATTKETFQAFAQADQTLDYLLGSDWGGIHAGAFPFGALPKPPTRNATRHLLSYAALFHAFGGPAKNPRAANFDASAINRYETRSTDDKPGGLAWLLAQYEFAQVTRE